MKPNWFNVFVTLSIACSSENKGVELVEPTLYEGTGVQADDADLGDGEQVPDDTGSAGDAGDDIDSGNASEVLTDTGDDEDPADTGEVMDTGTTLVVDVDGDGWATDEDCDDADTGVHPDAVEVCDGTDNNCDGIIDTDAVDTRALFEDWDGDGFGDPHSSISACFESDLYVEDDTDCDDTDASIYVGAPEYAWDSIDQDCDGESEYGPECVTSGVSSATSTLGDDPAVPDDSVLGHPITNQQLTMDVGTYTLVPTTSYGFQAVVPVAVGMNTEADPFRVGEDCEGWVSPVDQSFIVDLDLSLDGLWTLTVDVVLSPPMWGEVGVSDFHLVGEDCPDVSAAGSAGFLSAFSTHMADRYGAVLTAVVDRVTDEVHAECSG
jgi:hypothetical protein